MEDGFLKTFSKRLRLLRKKYGLTQQELGEKAGMSYKYLGEIERGEKNPSLLILMKVAAGLKINPTNLVCMIEDCCGHSWVGDR